MLFLLLSLIGAAVACPFYQVLETPGGDPTTNYTRLSDAIVAAAAPEFAVTIVVNAFARLLVWAVTRGAPAQVH